MNIPILTRDSTLDSIIRIYAINIRPLGGLHWCMIPKLCRV